MGRGKRSVVAGGLLGLEVGRRNHVDLEDGGNLVLRSSSVLLLKEDRHLVAGEATKVPTPTKPHFFVF